MRTKVPTANRTFIIAISTRYPLSAVQYCCILTNVHLNFEYTVPGYLVERVEVLTPFSQKILGVDESHTTPISIHKFTILENFEYR